MRLIDMKVGSQIAAVDPAGNIHEYATYGGVLTHRDRMSQLIFSEKYQAFIDQIGWDFKVLWEPDD